MGSQSATLANNNFYKSGSRRGNLLISSIRSILYAPIAIMTVSRGAVCFFWPRDASKNPSFTTTSSICSRLYAPIDNNNGFAWSCLHSLAKTMVSRGAVCIFLLKQRFRVELFAFSCYNNGFAWSCLHFLAKINVSRGAVNIFLLQPVAPAALKSAPGLPRPKK